MKISNFNKGIISSSSGSIWWGFLGTFYFQFVSFAGTMEVVIHRCIWTSVILLVSTFLFKKWYLLIAIFKNKKKVFYLLLTSLLIFGNWTVWIYAVTNDQIIDASYGYFIFPILSVLLGRFFFKEKLNKLRVISVIIVIFASTLMLLNMYNFPFAGFAVAVLWSTYNLIRKKINVDTDVGLLIESLFILPLALVIFYFIVINNHNDFTFQNPKIMLLLFLAGPMTVIPLFLYVKGVQLCGIGPSGMIFFITPFGQFLLGYFYFNEPFSNIKFLSFVLIWIAVFIYLKDLYENN